MDAYRLLPVPLLYPCYLVRNQPRSRLYWLVVEGFTTGEAKAPGKRKERANWCSLFTTINYFSKPGYSPAASTAISLSISIRLDASPNIFSYWLYALFIFLPQGVSLPR